MSWYTPSGNPLTQASGLSSTIRAEFQLIKSAFDSLPSSFGTMATQAASAVAITGGTINGTAIGGSTAAAGAFTTLSASGAVSGAGITAMFASPPAIGGTAAAAGSFTTLTASGAVSGAGITALFASPPAIGGTAAAAGTFTALAASGNLTLSGAPSYINGQLTSPTGGTAFKSTTSNDSTYVFAVPNGSGTTAGFFALSSSAVDTGTVPYALCRVTAAGSVDFSSGLRDSGVNQSGSSDVGFLDMYMKFGQHVQSVFYKDGHVDLGMKYGVATPALKAVGVTGGTRGVVVTGSAAANPTIAASAGNLDLGGSGGSIAFFGGTGGTKPTVSGSRGSNAALQSLLSALATLGLVTDSSS